MRKAKLWRKIGQLENIKIKIYVNQPNRSTPTSGFRCSCLASTRRCVVCCCGCCWGFGGLKSGWNHQSQGTMEPCSGSPDTPAAFCTLAAAPCSKVGLGKCKKDSKDRNLLQDLWGYLAQFKFTLDFHPIIPSSHCLPLIYYALCTESYYFAGPNVSSKCLSWRKGQSQLSLFEAFPQQKKKSQSPWIPPEKIWVHMDMLQLWFLFFVLTLKAVQNGWPEFPKPRWWDCKAWCPRLHLGDWHICLRLRNKQERDSHIMLTFLEASWYQDNKTS